MNSTTDGLTGALAPLVAEMPAGAQGQERAAREEQLRILVRSLLGAVPGCAYNGDWVEGIEDVPVALELLHAETGMPGYAVAAAMVRGALASADPHRWRGWLDPARDLLAGMTEMRPLDERVCAREDRRMFAAYLTSEACFALFRHGGYEKERPPADMSQSDRMTCVFVVESATHAVARSQAEGSDVEIMLPMLAKMRAYLERPEFTG